MRASAANGFITSCTCCLRALTSAINLRSTLSRRSYSSADARVSSATGTAPRSTSNWMSGRRGRCSRCRGCFTHTAHRYSSSWRWPLCAADVAATGGTHCSCCHMPQRTHWIIVPSSSALPHTQRTRSSPTPMRISSLPVAAVASPLSLVETSSSPLFIDDRSTSTADDEIDSDRSLRGLPRWRFFN